MPKYTFTRVQAVRHVATLSLEAKSALEAARLFAVREETGEHDELAWENEYEDTRESDVSPLFEDEEGGLHNRYVLVCSEDGEV